MIADKEDLKPKLSEPFPQEIIRWKDPKTGIVVPKLEIEN